MSTTNAQIISALVRHHIVISSDAMIADLELGISQHNYGVMLHVIARDAHLSAWERHNAAHNWDTRIDAKAQTVEAYDATVKSFQSEFDVVPEWASELDRANRSALSQSNHGEFCMHEQAAEYHQRCARMHGAFARSAGAL